MSLHRNKVAIIVEQRVPVGDAKGADDEVDGLADRDALGPEGSIVPRRGGGEARVEHRGHVEFAKFFLEYSRVRLGAHTLQDLTEDYIPDEQRLIAD